MSIFQIYSDNPKKEPGFKSLQFHQGAKDLSMASLKCVLPGVCIEAFSMLLQCPVYYFYVYFLPSPPQNPLQTNQPTKQTNKKAKKDIQRLQADIINTKVKLKTLDFHIQVESFFSFIFHSHS